MSSESKERQQAARPGRLSRREFLKLSGAVIGATAMLGMAGCGVPPQAEQGANLEQTPAADAGQERAGPPEATATVSPAEQPTTTPEASPTASPTSEPSATPAATATAVPGPEQAGVAQPAADIEIATSGGPVRGVLHAVEGARAAILMVSGAGGGVTGPANVYEPLANRLQPDGVTGLRLDYRQPNQLEDCVQDVFAAIDELERRGVERVVLVGWSFGGAVGISAGAASDAVGGVATVASQTYGTDAVDELSPKSLLLIHGTADTVLPHSLSQQLYAQAGEPKELVLYEGDGHGIDQHGSEMLEKLYGWSKALLLAATEGA